MPEYFLALSVEEQDSMVLDVILGVKASKCQVPISIQCRTHNLKNIRGASSHINYKRIFWLEQRALVLLALRCL